MHILQKKILELASAQNLGNISLRKIGEIIGDEHAQTVKYHLEQLIKSGHIKWDKNKKIITRVTSNDSLESNFFAIPIRGTANCGPATFFADNNIEGYLQVSEKVVRPRSTIYALHASGCSMNKAKISNRTIEDGDYIIVDSEKRSPENGDYVVSIIDETCNIKKYYKDEEHNQVLLLSESTEKFPPIIIHPEEVSYIVAGEVIQVVKQPK